MKWVASRFALPVLASLLGCAGTTGGVRQPEANRSLSGLDGTRWVWVEADCTDGQLDLARHGFERELGLEVSGPRLLMFFDSEIAPKGCSETLVWQAEPSSTAGEWAFVPQARVTLPADVECGAVQRDETRGVLRLSADMLEVVAYRSPWCRGFDARFVYRKTEPEVLAEAQLIRRYVAHFNRRDAAGIAALFAENGSLVEPFSETQDGSHARHDGRSEVQAWYASAFASAPWLAMRLTGIQGAGEAGQHVAAWQYMDGRLKAPLNGRNLFVIAGGEIFETEVQLLSSAAPGTPQVEESR